MTRNRYRFLKILFLLSLIVCTEAQNSGVLTQTTVQVGVILDLGTTMGKMSRDCIFMAVEDFYTVNAQYKTRLVLHIKDSNDVATAVFAAVELLKEEKVQVIVGPQNSVEAEFVAEIGNKKHVPVISFSATSPSLSRSPMPYFIRMTQNDTYQLQAIASIIQVFGWKEVVLIYEETDYGDGIIPSLIDAFQSINVRIPYKSVIPPSATENQILEELRELSASQTRVFIVHLSSSLAPLFFLKIKEVGLMGEGNVWIITEELTNQLGSMDDTLIDSMWGVIGIKSHIPRSSELDKFKVRMTRKILQESDTLHDFNIICLHAYDTIWAVALAVERVNESDIFRDSEQYEHITDLAAGGQMGLELLKEILRSKFKGLSGEICLVDGHLHPLPFQIVNIFGQGEREIGFWIPAVGLSQKPDGTSQSDLLPIIWPGESTIVPKGWVFHNGKKLKIGYLVNNAFREFVNVSSDGLLVTGYCIDVFKVVMDALPYVIPYEFVPFQKADGGNDGSDGRDLVEQDFLQKYDAVVGDITITARRSLLVDFSHPYTSGGVAMLIPIQYEKRSPLKNIFLHFPMNFGILDMGLFFIFTMFGVWSYIPSVHTISKKLSALIFSQIMCMNRKEKFIVLIFIIPVLILFGLFTLALLKTLTDKSGHLIEVDAKDLVKNRDFVGYQKGSLVEMVLKKMSFSDSQLKVYSSPEEYDDALQKGSWNGGVAAIFDEIPYLNLLQKKYCGKYRRAGPIYRMEGFGFVFPKGSALAPVVSGAILSVAEREKIVQIEKRWLRSERNCWDAPKNISPNILQSLKKFFWLFIIVLIHLSVSFLVLFMLLRREPVQTRSDGTADTSTDPNTDLTASDILEVSNQSKGNTDFTASDTAGNPNLAASNQPDGNVEPPPAVWGQSNGNIDQLSAAAEDDDDGGDDQKESSGNIDIAHITKHKGFFQKFKKEQNQAPKTQRQMPVKESKQ